MDDILKDFLVETAEHIEAAGEQLVRLERDPSDRDMISSIFRLVHTIKGTCGFLGLARLARISHAAESLIGRLRDGAAPSAEAVTLVLSTIDRVKEILAAIEQTGEEPEGEDDQLVAALQTFASGMTTPAVAQPAAIPAPEPADAAPVEAEPAPPVVVSGVAHDHQAEAARPMRSDTIRVTVDALESLMLLVSELVLTRNQLTEVTRANTDEAVKGALQRLSAVATDLQDAVMRARMQPMSRVFNALPRLARELAVDLGKKIDLVVEGAETELDRQLIDLVRDPLTHMIRNCADHGLEAPHERVQAGKPETGLIRVAASHEAGQITIEVVDDGRGLDVDRIRDKAAALGLATREQVALLSADDVFRFIFEPGFSTARSVTAISGRGVGLDVVRDNIQAIGGTVSVSSRQGVGARFLIRIPLTLAIAPSLIVTAGEQRFALPQAGVIEAVSVGPMSEHSIDTVQGALVLRLRDEILPVADLSGLLRLERATDRENEDRLVIVVRVGPSAFGVIVDSVDDVQEIVVKPLGSQLSHLRVYSGQTILGDGAVVLILDTSGIAEELGLERSSHYRPVETTKSCEPTRRPARVVLLRAGPGVCKALPLSLITRIESVDGSQIETTGQGRVIRHQGQLMPLLPAADGVTISGGEQPILVIGYGGESMGLLVDEIVDIVEDPLEIQIAQHSPGIIGTAEFGGVVAELLDLTHFIRAARPDSAERGVNRKFHILLVDDRLFFRDMLTPVLSSAGYAVTSLDSASKALGLIEKGANFDAIVTDTDMPDMDGYTFARAVRALASCAGMPIVALATQANTKTIQAARASGIDAVAGKFDRKFLLDALAETLDRAELASQSLEDRILAEHAA